MCVYLHEYLSKSSIIVTDSTDAVYFTRGEISTSLYLHSCVPPLLIPVCFVVLVILRKNPFLLYSLTILVFVGFPFIFPILFKILP